VAQHGVKRVEVPPPENFYRVAPADVSNDAAHSRSFWDSLTFPGLHRITRVVTMGPVTDDAFKV
jgi:hypothetical protein